MINRRKLITGLISFAAAPAIVRASSLMPVKSYFDPKEVLNIFYQHHILLKDWLADMKYNERVMIEITGIRAITDEEFYL